MECLDAAPVLVYFFKVVVQGALVSELTAFADVEGSFTEVELSSLWICQKRLAARIIAAHREELEVERYGETMSSDRGGTEVDSRSESSRRTPISTSVLLLSLNSSFITCFFLQQVNFPHRDPLIQVPDYPGISFL